MFTHARSGCGAEAGGFWYSRSATAGMFTHTRSVCGQICHFLRTMMVWSARFRSGRGKLGVGPISCGAVLLPLRLRSATAHVWTHVMICVEANFLPAPARIRPRMCERTLTLLPLDNAISLKFILRSPNDNKAALVQLMAWRWTDNKPLPEPMLTQFTDSYILH